MAAKSAGVVLRNGRLAALPALATTISGAPQVGAGGGEHGADLVRLRHVAGDEAHLGARHLGEGGGVAAGDGHLRAGADERAGDGRAGAAAAAGHQRVLAGEGHGQTLPSMVSVRSARRQSWLRPGR